MLLSLVRRTLYWHFFLSVFPLRLVKNSGIRTILLRFQIFEPAESILHQTLVIPDLMQGLLYWLKGHTTPAALLLREWNSEQLWYGCLLANSWSASLRIERIDPRKAFLPYHFARTLGTGHPKILVCLVVSRWSLLRELSLCSGECYLSKQTVG